MSFVIKNIFLQSKLKFLLRVFQLILFTKITSSLFALHIHLITLISAAEKFLKLITGQEDTSVDIQRTRIYNKKCKTYKFKTLPSQNTPKLLQGQTIITTIYHTPSTPRNFHLKYIFVFLTKK